MNFLTTTLSLLVIALAAGSAVQAQNAPTGSVSASSTAAPAANIAATGAVAKPERTTVQQNGLTFVLLRSARRDNVDTEEYFLENESPDNWSQMVTYQRITLPEPMGTDQYVGWLKSQLDQAGGAPRLRAVQSRREASIFGVQYPKDGKAEEQFGLALVMIPDARRPSELHLIQYALQTQRVPVEEMELQVKRWQARFQSEAATLVRGETVSRAVAP